MGKESFVIRIRQVKYCINSLAFVCQFNTKAVESIRCSSTTQVLHKLLRIESNFSFKGSDMSMDIELLSIFCATGKQRGYEERVVIDLLALIGMSV